MSITSDMDRISSALDAVEDGKAAIAEAITAKGVDTLPDDSFDTMAINVGLIDGGGGGGVIRQSGTVTMPNQERFPVIPTNTFKQAYINNSVLHLWLPKDYQAPADAYYHVFDAALFFSPTTRVLENKGGLFKSVSKMKITGTDGVEKKTPDNAAGSTGYAIRTSNNTLYASPTVSFNQLASGWQFGTGNNSYVFDVAEYRWEWVYFGNDPEHEIVNIE